MSSRARAALFFALAAASLLPWVGPAAALAGGVFFSLLVGNPAPARTASWRSGYAADCKSVYSGSNPDEASRFP